MPFILLVLIFSGLRAQNTVIHLVDSCFGIPEIGISFPASNNLVSGDADLLYWTGDAWAGQWPTNTVNLPPPPGSGSCRAIWLGDPLTWTPGGEYFAARFYPPLVAGTSYVIELTYASNGSGSSGQFAPRFSTSATTSLSSAVFVSNLPAAGTSWENNTLNFVATQAQAGHEWLIIKSNNSGSGMILSNCDTCRVPSVISNCTFSLGNDTTICSNTSILLGHNLPGSTYTWNTGNTSPFLSTGAAGTYWLQVNIGSCEYRDSITIFHTAPPAINLGDDIKACSCDTVIKITGNTAGQYLWSTGDATSALTLNIKDRQIRKTYSTTVTNTYGCTASDAVNVEIRCLNAQGVVQDPMGGAVLSGHAASLHVLTSGYIGQFSYQWQPANKLDDSAFYEVNTTPLYDTTTFYVVVTDDMGCRASDQVTIPVISPTLYVIPTAFTPNNDGINDVFGPVVKNANLNDVIKSITVYDRWGQLLYRGIAPWDGKVNGELQPPGNYSYTIEFLLPYEENPAEDKLKTATGMLSLLR